jgi:hypothetical protein
VEIDAEPLPFGLQSSDENHRLSVATLPRERHGDPLDLEAHLRRIAGVDAARRLSA